MVRNSNHHNNAVGFAANASSIVRVGPVDHHAMERAWQATNDGQVF